MAAPFSVDFNVSARDGQLWIKPWWGDRASEVQLHLRGVNWFGSAGSRQCMEEINRHRVQEYIDFMVRHGFVNPDEEGYVELMGALRSGVALSGTGRPEGSSVILP